MFGPNIRCTAHGPSFARLWYSIKLHWTGTYNEFIQVEPCTHAGSRANLTVTKRQMHTV